MNLKHLKNTKLPLVLAPILIVAIGMYIFSLLPQNKLLQLEGSVEISTNTYFAQVNGTVTELLVEAGQRVKTGDILAKLDDTALNNEIAQQKAVLVMKNAALNQLKNMPKVAAVEAGRKSALQNVSIAEEKLSSAERVFTQAEEALARGQELFQADTISKQALEDLENDVLEKESACTLAESAVDMAKTNVESFAYPQTDANEVDAALADIHLTELQIENLEHTKKNYVITAQNNGIVVNRSISPMSTVVTGQNLLELSKEDDRYFVFYLPEEETDKISYGDEIPIFRVNEDTPLGSATVTFMDWKSIYTPKDFENSTNQNKKSLKIKALINSDIPVGVGETLVTKVER